MILEKINNPSDLKKLKLDELVLLADEIRTEIIDTVSVNGGHLSASLGAVELVIALHYVFDTPNDKIIWDVGHQAYAHKLITGRREQFKTLRLFNGISGFLKRDESEYDVFGAGHSSTSISAALGIKEALKIKKDKDSKVVAVIGDGSLTAGIAFEGLDHSGHLRSDLIVVVNDNGMSISPNVGAISNFLSRKMTSSRFAHLRKRIKDFIRSLPGRFSVSLYSVAKRTEASFKSLVTPGILFEGLGFQYIGPIKGHNIKELVETFENVKNWDGAVLVHIKTQKGKGYEPAEKDPVFWHGVGSFDKLSGRVNSNGNKIPSYTKVFGDSLIKLAGQDDKIVAITAAMPDGTGLEQFKNIFPDRFYDIGIAEQHGITFAAGLAVEGLKPVAAIYSTFLQRAFDQIIHDVCLQNLGVTMALDRAGIVGQDGPTHHGIFDLSYLRLIPNMVIMAPKDEEELRHMLYTSVNLGKPCAIRYPRGKGIGVPITNGFRTIPVGKGEIVEKGNDVAIVAIGDMVYPSLRAREILVSHGISASVVNARFVKPIDEQLLTELAQKFEVIFTVENNTGIGGFGSAVTEFLAARALKYNRIYTISLPDIFVPHGDQNKLKELYDLYPEGIAKRIILFLQKT
ncbi:MAG: 1-deoxy-D-xylulose-5-phosphate synthase [Deltaproteobacteria bacterium]|nr:1-deoxy-D-xylulose-5-phosphate synthase [Deltaproteobacteria bacterium]